MALFGKGSNEKGQKSGAEAAPTMARDAHCRICRASRHFTKCWVRLRPLAVCPCCQSPIEDPQGAYRRHVPQCPRCEEFLEHPGFEYGVCDGCGSKFELVNGALPGLLPNKRQRDAMNEHGRSRSHD